MRPEHLGHLLHRVDPRTHRPIAPGIQELPCPQGGNVLPEPLEVLFEQVGPYRLEVAAQQLLELDLLFLREVLRPLQKTPAGSRQHRGLPLGLEHFDLLGPYLVDSLAHVAHDMEPIQNVDRLAGLPGDDAKVGLPHVAADESKPRASLLTEPLEKNQKRLCRTLFPHPEQTPDSRVDLIDQGDVALPSAPSDLVDADGADPPQISVLQPPGYRHLHRPHHAVPARMEDLRHFLPAQPPGPPCQKPHVGGGQGTLALGPRDALHLHSANRTIDPPKGIKEENQYPPKGNKLESTLRQTVIARSSATAPRTHRLSIVSGPNLDVQDQPVPFLVKTNRPVHKTRLLLDPIQDNLELHPVLLSAVVEVAKQLLYHERKRDASFCQTLIPIRPTLGLCYLPGGTHEFCGGTFFYSSDLRTHYSERFLNM